MRYDLLFQKGVKPASELKGSVAEARSQMNLFSVPFRFPWESAKVAFSHRRDDRGDTFCGNPAPLWFCFLLQLLVA